MPDMPSRPPVEAVIVCVDYSDFLAETLPLNIPLVDRILVVTSRDDRGTRDLCRRLGVQCVVTNVMYADFDYDAAQRVNKARAINHGLAHLPGAGWFLHLDADIVLPPNFRKIVDETGLDPACIHGMDRVNCHGVEAWDKYRADGQPGGLQWGFTLSTPGDFRQGSRYCPSDLRGYVPMGYFQLWHPGVSEIGRYPVVEWGDMSQTDGLHSMQWDRPLRRLIPDGYCVHLVTGKGQGENWSTRQSPAWRAPAAAPGPARNGFHDAQLPETNGIHEPRTESRR